MNVFCRIIKITYGMNIMSSVWTYDINYVFLSITYFIIDVYLM